MASDVERTRWDHTAAIIAAYANANRGKGQPVIKPHNPYRSKPSSNKVPLTADTIAMLGRAIGAK